MEFLSHPQSNPIFESTYTVFVTLIVALVALTSFQLKSESIRRYAKDMYSFGRNQLFKVCVSSEQKTMKQRLTLPPGPAAWPIVGNLPEIWRNKPAFKWIHSVMKELKTNISCIRLGNVHVIPVTSPEIALEVLKDNDSIFATRPLTMGTEYSSRGFLSVAVVPWGQQWKKMRKMVASHVLSSARLNSLISKRREEADNLVRFIYNQCRESASAATVVDVRLATRHYCGNVIRKMMFNRRYFGEGKEDGGPGFEEEEHVESLFVALQHLYSFTLSDYVPWMRVFDLEGHEKIISAAMKTANKYHDSIIDERVHQRRRHHDNKKEAHKDQDLLDVLISAKDENGVPLLSIDEIKSQCMDLTLATVDNPSNAAEWAIAEMINQPEILQKATEEIDRVVGKERLVQESDVPQLNYIKACLREVLRLHPVAPFNLPHVSTRDATIAGYFIPKGSHVLLSRIGLGRNPNVWKDPLKFIPERHIGSVDDHHHQVELAETELRFLSFSRGRRGCMGMALGSEMSVMLLARLLQGFNWSTPSDEEMVDLSESKCDLLMAKPLHARAKPRLPADLYPANN
ncbi:Phenylalanine N-monooxygenase [Citrus sinensis]|uniref:Phenylalanine N-monooxygenase n=1 Tax=Citrus sinensis TaxID=2711 RepID=A0ACB8L2L1_CITSI|nr:Phenylalanine N-monooxygenase [Citrus sinensis]